jgi:outer membrane protein OmpA-like peptidoglycan-associated protein
MMKTVHVVQIWALALVGFVAYAQEAPKTELELDYSYARYNPSASYTQGHSFNGGGGQFKYNFGQHFGLAADLQGYNSNSVKYTVPSSLVPGGATGTVSGNIFTYLFGPIIKARTPRAQPFADVLFGAAHSSVYADLFKAICQPTTTGCHAAGSGNGDAFAMSAGGGLDIPINQRVQFRVGEFDYLLTRFTNQFTNSNQNNFRYLGGLNINMGIPNPKVPSMACAAEPSEVLPWQGPVKFSATPTDFNPKHDLTYGWESSGGTAMGTGGAATVDTSQMQPGQYTMKANATDPKQKKNNTATCSAAFTVKQPHGPLVTCSASPSTVKPGDPITVTASGSSPDLSPIDKHSFSTSAGALKEGETTKGAQVGEFTSVATLDTSNVPSGPINVKVGVTDSHGMSGDCTASAEVVAPQQAPAMVSDQMVGQCDFKNAKKAARVDNECKASLDGVAMQLKNDPDDKLIVVGYSAPDEAGSKQPLGSMRAANIRDYLTTGEGKALIDKGRIEIRKSTDQSVGKQAQMYLVPPNGQLPVANTEMIDESALPTKKGKGSGN